VFRDEEEVSIVDLELSESNTFKQNTRSEYGLDVKPSCMEFPMDLLWLPADADRAVYSMKGFPRLLDGRILFCFDFIFEV
jgi:hypothetical protein